MRWQVMLAGVLLFAGMTACRPRPPKPPTGSPEKEKEKRPLSALIEEGDLNPSLIYEDKTLEKMGLDPRWHRMLTKGEFTRLKRDLKRFFDIELPGSSGSFVTPLEIGQTGGLPGAPKNSLVTFFMPPEELELFKEHVRERTKANSGFGRRWGAYSESTWKGEPERTRGFDFPVGTLILRCAGSIKPKGNPRDDAVTWTFPPTNEWVRYQYHDDDE